MPDGSDSFDVVVLGGGNGGYAAAFRAKALGLSVAVAERDKLGGTCLHRGCIPTKALLHAADLVDEIKSAGDFGILVDEPSVDWGKVLSFKDSVVGRMYRGLTGLAAKKDVSVVEGEGRLLDPKTVEVSGPDGTRRRLAASKGVVVAPGSYPRDLPFVSADGDRVHNSDHGLVAQDIPSSVVIVGGNYIGLEFASVYRSFGAQVDVVEALPRIAPAEDQDISQALEKLLAKRGIKFHTGATVSGARVDDSGVEVDLAGDGAPGSLRAERLLVAIGRAPRTSDLGLEDAGIDLDRGFIVTNEQLETAAAGVFAVGDAITVSGAREPHPQLAHVAFAEGFKVAERLAGEDPLPIDYATVPHVIYCQPEVAAVGLNQQVAAERGYDVVVERYPFSANARALMLGGGQGFVKTIAEKEGAILGVHIVGPRASDLITEAQLVTSWQAYPSELAELVHPHPTLSEALGETFLELAGKPLHGL